MLPIFQIVTQKTMSINERPRRKKPEVQVHKNQEDEPYRKTYSANFNSRKCRHKKTEDNKHFTEVILELPESERSTKTSKRQLNVEMQRLAKENEDVVAKFNELEELSVKKITRLKEKITSLQQINNTIIKDNDYIKNQYQELMHSFEEIKMQLEISQNCKTCEDLRVVVDKLSADNTSISKTNRELNEDLEMLKTVVYRLNMQLERYQESLRKNNIKVTNPVLRSPNKSVPEKITTHTITANILSESHSNHNHTPIAWGCVNLHTLGPLLDAYQDTLTEKEEIIGNYEIEISKFTGKLKEIIKENEVLHSKLTEDDECSAKLKCDIVKLKSEVKSTREQNDILIKKCALKQDKLEEVIKSYEQKVEQLKRDYGVAQEQYYRLKTDLVATKEKNKALAGAQDEFKNERHNYIPISVHTSSVNECKRWYEELKVQYEGEKRKLVDALEAKSNAVNELERKVSNSIKMKEELDGKIVQLEKQIKKAEGKYLDLEHTLNEVQLSRTACKKQLHKAMTFAKDMVAEQETLLKALNQRQIENKAVKKIGSDMATRMDSLKSQLKDVQKSAWAEFSTVEQRIQDQDSLIETMKEEHEKEIQELREIIKEQQKEKSSIANNETISVPHYLLYRDKHK
ncbi:unnamed protein product [Brassicogethes aeneus]|uniref:Uncharacterized protein n=1 Tax=Brassicogethes aeneus TaxID=1431903 RepID=A0A9P0B1K2_BRAAE|nr:unnamed protein product [Brassicogethes aeneus]